VQSEAEGPNDLQDGRELRVPITAQRFVKRLPRQAGLLGNPRHAARSGDYAQRIGDLAGIAVREGTVERGKYRFRAIQVSRRIERPDRRSWPAIPIPVQPGPTLSWPTSPQPTAHSPLLSASSWAEVDAMSSGAPAPWVAGLPRAGPRLHPGGRRPSFPSAACSRLSTPLNQAA